MDFHTLKRRELQALCKKHKIPANLTNLEMASKLSALLMENVKPSNRWRSSCLKALDKNPNVDEYGIVNRPAKNVRFSPENEVIEYEKSDVKYLGRRDRGRRNSMVKMSSDAVANTGKDLADEGVGRVTRSRRMNLVEGREVERTRGKRGHKGDILKDKLPSAADTVSLVDLTHEENVVVGKRSLRNTEDSEGVAGSKESEEEFASIKDKKVLRRSKRHVAIVDYHKLANLNISKSEKVVQVGSRSMVALGVKEGYGVDDISKKMVKEDCPVRDNLKRSKRNASKPEPLITMESNDEAANAKDKKETRKRRKVAVKQEEAVNIDGYPERPLRRSTRNTEISERVAPTTVGGKVAQKEKGRSKKSIMQIEDSFPEPESLITMEQNDAAATAIDDKEIRKRRKDAVQQEEAVKVDGSIERTLRQSTRTTETSERVAPTSLRGKDAKNEDRSKKTKRQVDDSFTEEVLTSEDLPAPEAELKMAEVAKDTEKDEFKDTVIDLHASVSGAESSDLPEANFVREGQVSGKGEGSPLKDKWTQMQDSGTNGKSVHPPSDDNEVQNQGGETYGDEKRNDGSDAKEALYMRKTPLTVKHDGLARELLCANGSTNDVMNELKEMRGITENVSSETSYVSVVKFTNEKKLREIVAQESKQLNLEDSVCIDNENPHPPIAVRKDTIDSWTAHSPLKDVDGNRKEIYTSTLHLMSESKKRGESMPIKENGCEARDLCSAETDFDHHELNTSEVEKSEDDTQTQVECDTLIKYRQPNASDAFNRSSTKKLQEGNVGSDEHINQPVGSQGRVLMASPISAEVVETVTQFSKSISDSKRTEIPKRNLLEFQDILCLDSGEDCGMICKNVHLPDNNVQKQGESLSTMELETHSELKIQSPSEEGKSIENEFFEDGQVLIESSKYTEFGYLKHQDDPLDYSSHSHELNSCARNKPSFPHDRSFSNTEVSVAISDAQGKCTDTELSARKSSPVSITPPDSSSILKNQSAGPSIESECSLLTGDSIQDKEYGVGSGLEQKEEIAVMQESYRIKMPSTSKDDCFGACNISSYGSLNELILVSSDDLGSVTEGMEPEGDFASGSNAVMEQCLYESYTGEEGWLINLEKGNCNEPENYHNVAAVSEGENTTTINSRKTLQMEELSLMQIDDHEAHNPSASETISYGHELNSDEDPKSDSKDLRDTFDKFQESVPDDFRRSTRKMLQDGNVQGDRNFVQPSDLQGIVSTSIPISSPTIETLTEFGENISDFGGVESPKVNSNFEFQNFREDSGFTYQSKCSPLPDKDLQKQGTSTDNVGLEEHSEERTKSPSKQTRDFDEDFVVEEYTELEDEQNYVEVAKSEKIEYLKDQDTPLDDHLQQTELDSSARSNCSSKQDQGVSSIDDIAETAGLPEMMLCPHCVATPIAEERQRETELSTRQSSSMSKNTPNFDFISEFDGTNTENEQCLLTNNNVQTQGDGACSEGESEEENDPMQALDMTQMPSSSKDDGSGGSNTFTDRSLSEDIHVLNDELGPVTGGMEPNGICESAIEEKMQESYIGEEARPIKLDANNTSEPEPVHSTAAALEGAVATTGILDDSPSHAADTPSKNSNEKEQGGNLEMVFKEFGTVSNTTEEENTFSLETDNMMSLKKTNCTQRDGLSRVFDEEFSVEEREKVISIQDDCVDAATAVENEIQSMNQQNIVLNSVEGSTNEWDFNDSWHGDELKMLFGNSNSNTGHKGNVIQEQDHGALDNSSSHVYSAESRDCLVLKESTECNGTVLQHDEHKIDDLDIQKESEVCEEIRNDEHTSSVAEMPLEESNGGESFSFEQTKDVEEGGGTSRALSFANRVTFPGIHNEEKVAELDILDSRASEFSIPKNNGRLKECDVDTTVDYIGSESSESMETLSLSTNIRDNTLDTVAELIPLVDPEAEIIEETIEFASINESPSAEEQEKGETREEADHQCLVNEDGGTTLEDAWSMHSKNNSSGSENLDRVTDETIKSPAKQLISTVKRKNARTILIHGTPKKLRMTVDMKENAPYSKIENVGTLTTVKPAAKRPALKDLLLQK